MLNVGSDPELKSLLAKFNAAGGVLDFVFLEQTFVGSPYQRHRDAALAGMVQIDRWLQQWAVEHVSAEYPIENFFKVRWDESKLTGEQVSFPKFWGTDSVQPEQIVDGYKTAFFCPPHRLRGLPNEIEDLFARINLYVLGTEPQQAEIYAWSTNWSTYFEHGQEWWGAFYWTICPSDPQRMIVVGASTTD